MRLADDESAHDAGVVAKVRGGKLDGELIIGIEPPRSRHSTAVECALTGVHEWRAGRDVTTAHQHGGEPGRGDFALEDAGPCRPHHRGQRVVGELSGTPDMDDLRLGFHDAERTDDVRSVFELAPAV